MNWRLWFFVAGVTLAILLTVSEAATKSKKSSYLDILAEQKEANVLCKGKGFDDVVSLPGKCFRYVKCIRDGYGKILPCDPGTQFEKVYRKCISVKEAKVACVEGKVDPNEEDQDCEFKLDIGKPVKKAVRVDRSRRTSTYIGQEMFKDHGLLKAVEFYSPVATGRYSKRKILIGIYRPFRRAPSCRYRLVKQFEVKKVKSGYNKIRAPNNLFVNEGDRLGFTSDAPIIGYVNSKQQHYCQVYRKYRVGKLVYGSLRNGKKKFSLGAEYVVYRNHLEEGQNAPKDLRKRIKLQSMAPHTYIQPSPFDIDGMLTELELDVELVEPAKQKFVVTKGKRNRRSLEDDDIDNMDEDIMNEMDDTDTGRFKRSLEDDDIDNMNEDIMNEMEDTDTGRFKRSLEDDDIDNMNEDIINEMDDTDTGRFKRGLSFKSLLNKFSNKKKSISSKSKSLWTKAKSNISKLFKKSKSKPKGPVFRYGYKLYRKKVCRGVNLGGRFKVKSTTDCKNKCNINKYCVAIEYSARRCQLKKTCTKNKLITNRKTNTYIKTGPVFRYGYKLYRKKVCRGVNLGGRFKVKSTTDCKNKCNINKYCVAIEYSARRCQLKKTCTKNKLITNRKTNTYIKTGSLSKKVKSSISNLFKKLSWSKSKPKGPVFRYGYKLYRKKVCRGVNLGGRFKVKSTTDCKNKCNINKYCVAIEYSARRCQLKKTCTKNKLITNRKTNTYIKTGPVFRYGYKLYRKKVCRGVNLGGRFKVKSTTDCKNKCNINKYCVAIEYSARRCQLKKTCTKNKLITNRKTNTYIKTGSLSKKVKSSISNLFKKLSWSKSKPKGPVFGYGFKLYRNSVCRGGNLGARFIAKSTTDCKNKCNINKHCVAIEYSRRRCQLKKRCTKNNLIARTRTYAYIKTGHLLIGIYRPHGSADSCRYQLVSMIPLRNLEPGQQKVRLRRKVQKGDRIGVTSLSASVVSFRDKQSNSKVCNRPGRPVLRVPTRYNTKMQSGVGFGIKAMYRGNKCKQPNVNEPCNVKEKEVLSCWTCRRKRSEKECRENGEFKECRKGSTCIKYTLKNSKGRLLRITQGCRPRRMCDILTRGTGIKCWTRRGYRHCNQCAVAKFGKDYKCQRKAICKPRCRKFEECTFKDTAKGKETTTCQCTHGSNGKCGKGCVNPARLQCSASGDPHYRTFDAGMIHFQGTCKYLLVGTKDKSTETPFKVFVQNEHRNGRTHVAYTTVVTVEIYGKEIVFSKGSPAVIKINGKQVSRQVANRLLRKAVKKGFEITRKSDGTMVLDTPFGGRVEYDGRHRASVTLTPNYCQEVQGICGNMNGKKYDDYETKAGVNVIRKKNRYTRIGNSWKVPTPAIKRCTDPTTDLKIPKKTPTECIALERVNKKNPLKNCFNMDSRKEYLEDCKYDLAQPKMTRSERKDRACDIINAFAKDCETNQNGVVVGWRKIVKCPLQCPTGMVYTTTACPATCEDPDAPKNCDLPDVDGCQCRKGHVLSGDICIKQSKCPVIPPVIPPVKPCKKGYSRNRRGRCIDINECKEKKDNCGKGTRCRNRRGSFFCTCKGRGMIRKKVNNKVICIPRPCKKGFYRRGSRCLDINECRTGRHNCGDNTRCRNLRGSFKCTCVKKGMMSHLSKDNKIVCEKMLMCRGSGDPHFYTYDGEKIDFMGTCVYTMSKVCKKVKNFPNFDISIKNEHRYGKTRVAYSQYILVDMYGLVIKLDQGKKVYVENAEVKVPYVANKHLKIAMYGRNVAVITDRGVKVIWDGSKSVRVYVPESYKGHLCGICGNADGNRANDMTTQEGTLAKSDSEVGDSWQVAGVGGAKCLPVTDELPKCEAAQFNKVTKDSYCGLLTDKKGVFAPCHKIVDSKAPFDDCTFDTCIDESPDHSQLCSALEEYASVCQVKTGETIAWRPSTNLCPMKCDVNSEYNPKMSACPSTCADVAVERNAEEKCTEQSSVEGCACKTGYVLDGTKCVLKSKCGCSYKGQYHSIGDKWINSDCSVKYWCEGFQKIKSVDIDCNKNGSVCEVNDAGKQGCYCGNDSCEVESGSNTTVPIDKDEDDDEEPPTGGSTLPTMEPTTGEVPDETTTEETEPTTSPLTYEPQYSVWTRPIFRDHEVVVLPKPDADDDSGYFQLEPAPSPKPKPRPLGMQSCVIKNPSISATSEQVGSEAHKARPIPCDQKVPSGWKPTNETNIYSPDYDGKPHIEIDLGSPLPLHGIGTLGHYTEECWATEYEIHVSDGTSEKYKPLLNLTTGQPRIFTGNHDQNTWKRHCLHKYYGEPITAKYVRLIPVSDNGCIGLRMELYGFRPFSDPQLITALEDDSWTKNTSSCTCYFDIQQTDCACCEQGGCQCPSSNRHQCVQCGYAHHCGIPENNQVKNQTDPWTKSETGCTCPHDNTRKDCACCQNFACPCGKKQPNQCVHCGQDDDCGKKPEIFGEPPEPPVCVPKTCPSTTKPQEGSGTA